MMNRILSFIFLLLTASASFSFAADQNLEVTFLNTGYADSILIQTPEGENILLDSGDVTKPDLVSEFLKKKGVTRLKLAIISHPHKNHFGAFFKVLDEVSIEEIVWNGDPNQEEPFAELLQKIKEKKIPLRALKAGDNFQPVPSLSFTVYHPGNEMTQQINANSLLLKMIYGKVSFLFTTDITPLVQDEVIEKYGDKLSANLVQVPHHGGPMTNTFIDFFKPDFFALSTGPNEYFLPMEDQVSRLKAAVRRTDQHGNLIFKSDGSKLW